MWGGGGEGGRLRYDTDHLADVRDTQQRQCVGYLVDVWADVM